MNITVKPKAIVKHVRAHKTAYAVLATATTCLYLNRRALRMHDDFLKEKGLYAEFYCPEDE